MDSQLTDRAEDATRISAALEEVVPHLRRVREERGFTLTEMSERTGISKSTLSRLENGHRKASLELLLPLAQAYRVPLDDTWSVLRRSVTRGPGSSRGG